jgi:hypothetical protein
MIFSRGRDGDELMDGRATGGPSPGADAVTGGRLRPSLSRRRGRLWPVLLVVVALAASCTNHSPNPLASGHAVKPSPTSSTVPPIPDGLYRAVVTRADADQSKDPNIVALSEGLIGPYELTLRHGTYRVTLNGEDTLPHVVPSRPGVEGGYIRYGYWVSRGVPPIGEGTYNGNGQVVAFHSSKGACFQKGLQTVILSGLYRWSVHGDSLTFAAQTTPDFPSLQRFGAGQDDCLGRAFVLTLHPWIRAG